MKPHTPGCLWARSSLQPGTGLQPCVPSFLQFPLDVWTPPLPAPISEPRCVTLQRHQQLSLSTPKFPWPHLPSQLAFLSAPVQEAVKAPVNAQVPLEQWSHREQPAHSPPTPVGCGRDC